MNGYVANTDLDWFDFLARREDEEVNFWTPSPRPFKVLREGEPLVFRLKAPRNRIGGFGIFERYTVLPDWLAWQTFGHANGAPDFASMSSRLRAIRSRNTIEGPAAIGCIVLAQPVFLPGELQVALPPSWRRNIVSGKGYDLTVGDGADLWRGVLEAARLRDSGVAEGLVAADARYGEPQVFRPRLGQAGFRVAVLDSYERSCAVTTEHSLPVLEAAHIRPYADGGPHAVSNGLLLRADLHKLFDCGYVTVTEDHHFLVSPRLRADFDNGRAYYPLSGQALRLPRDPAARPDPQALEWHRDVRYLG